jgi:biopolymer transport protein ExbB
VEDGQLSYEEASEICEEFDCPVAEVFQAAIRRWGRPMLEVEQAVMDAGDRVSDSLNRFVRVFHAISNVAPLIGLLGTVLGMIESFEMMSNQESLGRPEMLASGISVALITTAGGLVVAIPAYLAYMYFSSKSEGYLNEIDKLCQRVIDCISAEGLETAGNGRTRSKRRAA